MKLKQVLVLMSVIFCVVAIFIPLILSIVTLSIGEVSTIYVRHLYRYPLTAFLSVLPTLLYIRNDSISAAAWRIRRIIHAILTVGVVIGMQLLYGWLVIDWRNVRNMWIPLCMIVVPYIAGVVFAKIRTKWLAQKLSERIYETYKK